MAEHPPYTARIAWQRQPDEAFTDNRYSRRHTWHFDGGAVVHGSASPNSVRLPYADASAVDPEEALVAAASSCHMLCFLYRAALAGLRVERYDDQAEGTMARDAQGHEAITRIVLRPAVRFAGESPAREVLERLHHQAHEDCYIAHSLKAEIACEPVEPA